MKLYNVNLSPFAARVRIQARAKDLALEIVDPPGGTGSETYKRLVPTGKVPALEADGGVIAESTAILEYLEDRFPEPSLRPSDLLDRARMRTLIALVENYVTPSLTVLFGQVNPALRDAAVVAQELERVLPRIAQLEQSLDETGPYAAGPELSLADCTLYSIFFFATRVLALLGEKDPTAVHPKLGRWWEAVRAHDAVAAVDAELERALAEALGSS